MSNKVKVTVLQKSLQTKLIEEYSTGNVAPCSHFEIGDEFIATTNSLPGGVCAWAFGDIAKDFALVAYDTTCSMVKITCCTSAFHNVYFKLEAIDEKSTEYRH